MSEIKINENLLNNYEDYYEGGDSEWRRLGAIEKVNNIHRLCTNLPICSVLEIGAGEGSVTQRMSETNLAKEYYALEISPSGVKTIINKNIPDLKECKLFDGYTTTYADKQFDLVVLTHVIEHVEHPRQLIYEAKRIAKYVFIEVPLEDTIRLPHDFVMNKVGHINFYSPQSIRNLLQSCDLKIRDQYTNNLSKEIYSFEKGSKGLINFYIKEFLITFFPRIATQIFTYHSALICEDNINS